MRTSKINLSVRFTSNASTDHAVFIFLTCHTGDGREKPEEGEKNTEMVDVLLCSTFCQSQFNLSQQLAQIHPELTMPMFSG